MDTYKTSGANELLVSSPFRRTQSDCTRLANAMTFWTSSIRPLTSGRKPLKQLKLMTGFTSAPLTTTMLSTWRQLGITLLHSASKHQLMAELCLGDSEPFSSVKTRRGIERRPGDDFEFWTWISSSLSFCRFLSQQCCSQPACTVLKLCQKALSCQGRMAECQ